MSLVQDPEAAETQALQAVVDLGRRRVLEVGCGDGRLTWRYAAETAEVLGIDPDEESIATARAETPSSLAGKVRFEVMSAVELDVPRARFDVALLAWSL